MIKGIQFLLIISVFEVALKCKVHTKNDYFRHFLKNQNFSSSQSISSLKYSYFVTKKLARIQLCKRCCGVKRISNTVKLINLVFP